MTPWNTLVSQCTAPKPRPPRARTCDEERIARLAEHKRECEERVFEAIQEGVSTTPELIEAVEMGATTTRIHIKSLLKQGKIIQKRGVCNASFFYTK